MCGEPLTGTVQHTEAPLLLEVVAASDAEDALPNDAYAVEWTAREEDEQSGLATTHFRVHFLSLSAVPDRVRLKVSSAKRVARSHAFGVVRGFVHDDSDRLLHIDAAASSTRQAVCALQSECDRLSKHAQILQLMLFKLCSFLDRDGTPAGNKRPRR